MGGGTDRVMGMVTCRRMGRVTGGFMNRGMRESMRWGEKHRDRERV